MESAEALTQFERFVDEGGIPLSSMPPSAAFGQLLRYYAEMRATDCDEEADQDMLLFQWGTYDWGAGEHFELDLTRQFMQASGDDEGIWQLHMTFRFPPEESLRALQSGDKWCRAPHELPYFDQFIRAHPAYLAVADRVDGELALNYECAG